MQPTRTLIVVADGARARFLVNDGPGKGLRTARMEPLRVELQSTHELGTERPGRMQVRGQGPRHAIQPHADWHEYEKERFARAIATVIDRETDKGTFSRVILVAPPRTLGELRKSLGPATAKIIHGELAKDLTPLDDRRLAPHLDDLLAL